MKIWALRFFSCAIFATALSFLPVTASAQTAAGVIKAGKVDGSAVFRLTADGQSIAIKAGDTLTESDTVQTGRGSSMVLVFANGSSVRVGSDTKLKIEEFKMDPLAGDIVVARLTSEPSVSKTELRLEYGEMVGDVKKLNTASTFNIQTPVGAAGIRGTQFRIVFRPTGDGRAFTFSLSTAEGRVDFTGTTQAAANALPVADQQEIVITGNVDPTTGQITFNPPTSTSPISPEAAAQINTAVGVDIATATETVVVTPPTPEATPETPETTPESTSTSTPPPPIVQVLPDLTPGAGGGGTPPGGG